MIFYNNSLARLLLKKKSRESFMLFGLNFSKRRFPDPCKDMKMRIKEKQYQECFLLGLIPALFLGVSFSPWFILLPIFTYRILYVLEWLICKHIYKTNNPITIVR